MTDPIRFPISCNTLTRVAGVLAGMTPPGCWIEVADHAVRAQMGPLCSITIPRELVTGAEEITFPWWHGFGGRIYGRMAVGFVGSHEHVVELRLSKPVTAVNLFPKRCTRFAVSVDEPGALLAAASPVATTSH